ncbi:hypothetical protein GCM10009675_17650 [Prauserella alba]|uniref:Uncharacterized protein n=1 Tax=Prauserella alba TaxID=176898 RepID=A0ABP4FYC8_9PSEU
MLAAVLSEIRVPGAAPRPSIGSQQTPAPWPETSLPAPYRRYWSDGPVNETGFPVARAYAICRRVDFRCIRRG